LLLDLVMPGFDGYRVLQEKSCDAAIRHIPTIAISAQDSLHSPTVSNGLFVTKNGGIIAPDLLKCIRSLSETLAPPDQLADPGLPGTRCD
jgi:CheY-like chemotaxis protein